MAGTLTVPKKFIPTHQTGGLPGYPAVDLFAVPGTPCVLDEDVTVTRVSGHDPKEYPPQGVGGPWGLSCYAKGHETGNVYFLTHFSKVARPGPLPKGETVGVIGDYPGLAADHVHVGIHQGDSPAAYAPSKKFPRRCYITRSANPAEGKPKAWWVWLNDFLRRGKWHSHLNDPK